MYHAKEEGRNNFQFYSNSLNAAATERLVLEGALRHAIEREEFVVYYQPQIDLRTGGVIGAEALVRWQHPQRGLLLPAEFLPAAMDAGLIRLIDEWVLRTACRQNQAWQARGLMPVRMAVNVSHSLFHGSSLLSVVEETLRQTGLTPACLDLELTESVAMRNVEASITMLSSLKAMGVQLSIDDFGTGYSSLSYLQRLPINLVKIDQSFIREIIALPSPAPRLSCGRLSPWRTVSICMCWPKGLSRRLSESYCLLTVAIKRKAISSDRRCRLRPSPRYSRQSVSARPVNSAPLIFDGEIRLFVRRS